MLLVLCHAYMYVLYWWCCFQPQLSWGACKRRCKSYISSWRHHKSVQMSPGPDIQKTMLPHKGRQAPRVYRQPSRTARLWLHLSRVADKSKQIRAPRHPREQLQCFPHPNTQQQSWLGKCRAGRGLHINPMQVGSYHVFMKTLPSMKLIKIEEYA